MLTHSASAPHRCAARERLLPGAERQTLDKVPLKEDKYQHGRQLPDKLAQNEIILRQGENELALPIPNRMVLELKVEEEAKAAGTKRKLEIEIEWTDGDDSAGGVTLG